MLNTSSDMWHKTFWERHGTTIIVVLAFVLLLVCLFLIAYRQEIRRSCALSKERRRKQKYLNMTHSVIAGDTETRVYTGEPYAPPIPEMDGLTFKGWFIDTALTVPWKSTDRVECDLVLYPKWE